MRTVKKVEVSKPERRKEKKKFKLRNLRLVILRKKPKVAQLIIVVRCRFVIALKLVIVKITQKTKL